MKAKKILIVDDDRFYQQIISLIVKRFSDAELFFASDGNVAVEIFKEIRPDLVFIDLNMPISSGDQAIKRIREFDKKTPIIMVSGDILSCDEQIIGTSDFVLKPFSSEHLERFCT